MRRCVNGEVVGVPMLWCVSVESNFILEWVIADITGPLASHAGCFEFSYRRGPKQACSLGPAGGDALAALCVRLLGLCEPWYGPFFHSFSFLSE
jgi:hypothetical protein